MFYPPPYPPPPPPPRVPVPEPVPPPPNVRPVGLERYVAATAITVLAILSQYFLPQSVPALWPIYGSYVGDFLVVYGIPITAFLLLVGAGPLRNWDRNVGAGFVEGFRWYGLLTVIGLMLSIVAIIVIVATIGPGSLNVLSKPTPIVKTAAQDPYLWVALSFLIGFVEETIFRGWIFGYWLLKDPGRWKIHAAWTSCLFAGVHVYYALTYGIVFVLPLIILIADGLAFALGYRYSGGSLLGISFLHGWNDATAFLAITLPVIGLTLHYLVVLIGLVVALSIYLRQQRSTFADRTLRPI